MSDLSARHIPQFQGGQDHTIFQPYPMDIVRRSADAISQDSSYRPQNWLERLFPSQYEKLARNEELKLLATQHEYRRKALTLVGKTLCEDLNIRCTEYLEQVRIRLDGATQRIVLDELLHVQRYFDERMEQVINSIDEQLERLNQIKSPALRQHLEARLERSICQIEVEMETLLVNFKERLYRRVSLD